MAIDKSKVLKSAEKYLSAGKINPAIEEYLKILKEHPKDWNLMIQLGDMYLKVNKTSEAIQHFLKVADHYYSDGFFLKAIAIYKRITKLDPSQIEVCIKLADLYLKQGLTMDAKSQLQVVSQHYLAKNKASDAIRTLKMLIEIEPENIRTRNDLAKVYKNENLIEEAVAEYLEISEQLTRKGLTKESMTVLEQAYKLDPKSSSVLRKILMIYVEQNDVAKATSFLEESLKIDPSNPSVLGLLAESYADVNQWDKAYHTIDQAIQNSEAKEPFWELKGDLYLKEGDMDKAFLEYSLVADSFVDRNETEKAINVLQKILRVDASFPPVLNRLIEIYSGAKRQADVISTYNSLVDAYISRTMYEEAAECLEKLIQFEPENVQHQEKLEFVRSFWTRPRIAVKQEVKEFEPAAELPVSALPSSDLDLEVELDLEKEPTDAVVDSPVAATPPVPEVVHEPVAARTESPDQEKEFVSEHMIEAEVFSKYGLMDKAIEQLQLITSGYPGSVVARQKLKDIFLEKGERDKAVVECVAMSRIFRNQGDLDQAEDLLSEARQIQPNHPILESAYEEAPSFVQAAEVVHPEEPVTAKEEPVLQQEEIETEPEESPEEDTIQEIDFYISQGLIVEARKLLLEMKDKFPHDSRLSARLEKIHEEAPVPQVTEPVLGEVNEPETEPVESQPSSLSEQQGVASGAEIPLEEENWELGDIVESDVADQVEAEKTPVVEPLFIPEKTGEPPISKAPAIPAVEIQAIPDLTPDVSHMEAEPFERLPEAPEEVPAPVESVDAALSKAFEAEEELTQESSPVKAPEQLFEEKDEDFYDLAAELEEGFLNVQGPEEGKERPLDGHNYSLEDMLTDFKKGVEKQVGAEDYDTRYNLGIAYKEMGLIDEAIAEFQVAAKDPQRFVECCSMLGLCFVEKGLPKLAVKWYQRGLEQPGCTEEEYQGLRFDLAQAYEILGEVGPALEAYQEVYGINAGYRNVAKKIKELQENPR
jgi:tetratricopeptide (TPR) repeat protein